MKSSTATPLSVLLNLYDQFISLFHKAQFLIKQFLKSDLLCIRLLLIYTNIVVFTKVTVTNDITKHYWKELSMTNDIPKALNHVSTYASAEMRTWINCLTIMRSAKKDGELKWGVCGL